MNYRKSKELQRIEKKIESRLNETFEGFPSDDPEDIRMFLLGYVDDDRRQLSGDEQLSLVPFLDRLLDLEEDE